MYAAAPVRAYCLIGWPFANLLLSAYCRFKDQILYAFN